MSVALEIIKRLFRLNTLHVFNIKVYFNHSQLIFKRLYKVSIVFADAPSPDADCISTGTASESSRDMMDLDEFLSTHAGRTTQEQSHSTNDQLHSSGDRLTDLLNSIQRRQAEQLTCDSWSPSEFFDGRNIYRQRRKPRTYKYNPKPVIQKGNRSFVPDTLKDEEYWERRQRNNLAAKKSREDRRRKELEVLDKLASLEKSNNELSSKVSELEKRNQYLEERLRQFESDDGATDQWGEIMVVAQP